MLGESEPAEFTRAPSDGSSKQVVRSVFRVPEHGPVNVPLDKLMVEGRLDLYPEVTGSSYFSMHLKGSNLVFQAGGYVGLIPVNDLVAIDVYPRVPVANLERLLSTANYAPVSLTPYTRRYAMDERPNPSLLDTLTSALLGAFSEIERRGLYREYQQRLEDTSSPRGRLLLDGTIRRHFARGVKHRATASWFEASVDNPPNRCLRYTIWYLAQRYLQQAPIAGRRQILSRLNLAFLFLQGVSLDLSRSFLGDPRIADPSTIPSLRSYYGPALRLADLIIKNRGIRFSSTTGDLELASFVLNMEEIFETYLRAVLTTKLGSRYPTTKVLDGNVSGTGGAKKKLFNLVQWPKAGVPATPDIVLSDSTADTGDMRYRVVLEVKYKVVELVSSRDDLNQTIAYGISYGVEDVVIIHPRAGERSRLTTLGTIGPVTVHQYMFDLAAADLDQEEDSFVAQMMALMR